MARLLVLLLWSPCMMAVPIVTASAMRHIHNMETGRVRRKNIVVASMI